MSDESILYKEAMEQIDVLVEDVIQTCLEVADKSDFDRVWVMEKFRSRFNKAKRTKDYNESNWRMRL
ncbi:hypothetical protein ACTNDN_20785 [Niallia sp. HCP3S3_B10]|uniref:hypothetical protein n=1 Tax=Niallia sp. HCP3S3_B10 TaxID=3438944 RepID=UPI003F8B6CAA